LFLLYVQNKFSRTQQNVEEIKKMEVITHEWPPVATGLSQKRRKSMFMCSLH